MLANKKMLGVFSLAMINVAAIVNLNNLPSIVTLGYSLITYLLLAIIFFFLPTVFISAELATGWPEEGGFYSWVKTAYGTQMGFVAIWLQWLANIIWYPTLIAPIIINIFKVFFPGDTHTTISLFISMQVIFWILTLVNLYGMRTSSLVTIVGTLLGSILPAVSLIVFAIIWVMQGLPIKTHFHVYSIFPQSVHISNITIIISIIVTLVGIEMSAVHVSNIIRPQKTYPKAILLSTFLIISIFILTSIAMVIIVSPDHISIVNGVIQSIDLFLNTTHLSWLIKPSMILLVLGVMATASAWILGPSRGLYIATVDENFPRYFKHLNQHRVPSRILILQAILFSLISSLFIFIPEISHSYWILIALTGQLYMIMYSILFFTGIKLRYKHSHVVRHYTIPGKYNSGMWLMVIFGLVGTTTGFIFTFFPPAQIVDMNGTYYRMILFSLLAICFIIPIIYLSIQKKS